ncbi:MAG: amidohydrolase family protein [Thermoleophilia bacterium]
MLDLKIINGTLVIPGQGRVRGAVGCKDGKIVAVDAEEKLGAAARTVDASGKYVIPGVIDPHVHLGIFTGDFGYEAEHETRAALAGGITTIGMFMGGDQSYLGVMPGLIETAEAKLSTDLFVHLSMFTPQQLEEIPQYIEEFGVTSFKFYMCGVKGVFPNVGDDYILDGLKRLKALGGHLTGCVHCEDQTMVDEAFAKLAAEKPEGDLCAWAEAGPACAEEDAVVRACRLAAEAEARLYIVHMSSELGVKAAKANRPPTLFVETTSPYLSLTKNDPSGLLAKMLPPIKDEADREALWEAVKDGTIDSIGTDNVSLNKEIKGAEKGMLEAMPGYPVLQTHLPVLLHEGVHRRGVALERIVELTSKNPAQIFGVYPRKGTIAVGSDADLVVVDLEKEQVVDQQKIYSFADFSLYEGRTLKGWPVMTIKGGVVAVDNNEILVEPGVGSYLRRVK